MNWEIILGVAGTVGGLFALYVRLTLSDLIVKTLDQRYPSQQTFSAVAIGIHESIKTLPCQTGRSCKMGGIL